MKKIISLLSGTLCSLTFFVNAENAAVEAPAATTETQVSGQDQDVQNPETEAQATATAENGPAIEENNTAVDPQENASDPDQKAKKRGSWWDQILKFLKVDNVKRTTGEAYNEMGNNQNVVIDFSNVTDFAQNGEAKMAEYYNKIKATKSFGSNSPNLYVNLSNTGVSNEFVAKWAGEFAKDKKTVIWNLSDNPNLDDGVIDSLDLPSIRSLNLSGTSVSDAGITKIGAMLEANGIGQLVCVHLSGTKVTEAGVAALKNSTQKAVEVWKAKNPGKNYELKGQNNSGVEFEKIPTFPKHPGPRGKKGLNQPESASQAQENAASEPSAAETTDAATAAIANAQTATEPATPETPSVEGEATKALSDAETLVNNADKAETQQETAPAA